MKHNLGATDRVLRFALAFWFLGPWHPEFALSWVNWIIVILGIIGLIESFVGWCWLHSLF